MQVQARDSCIVRNKYVDLRSEPDRGVQAEADVMDALARSDVLILAGETGSGKTTQVPQFFWEAGYATHYGALERVRGAAAGGVEAASASAAEAAASPAPLSETAPAAAAAAALLGPQQQQRNGSSISSEGKPSTTPTSAAATTDAPAQSTSTSTADAPATADPLRPVAVFRGIPGMIGVTQPRRVAAVAMAQRVAAELGTRIGGSSSTSSSSSSANSSSGGPVGYQVRYDASTVSFSTKLKFMTDGILLREASHDLLLRQYSVIIIDEAHERGVNSDVLVGLLSRALPLRNALARTQAEAACAELAARRAAGDAHWYPDPRSLLGPLKLVIMSATLRTADFTENEALFPVMKREHRLLQQAQQSEALLRQGGSGGPIGLPRRPLLLHVQARQHPVSIHFSRSTPLGDEYGPAAFKKTADIHTRLPPGGILVFLTGAAEVEALCTKLRERFDVKKRERKRRERAAASAAAAAAAVAASSASAVSSGMRAAGAPTAAAAAAADNSSDDAAEQSHPQPASPPSAPSAHADDDTANSDDWGPVRVLPLYALLPPAEQQRVFAPVPEGTRLIVVATNVAETSLTIPGMR